MCLQGVLIEVLQYWSGYRYGDWQDAVADAVGVGLGLVLARGVVWWLIKMNWWKDAHEEV